MSLDTFNPGEAVHCYLSSCATSSGGIADPTALKFTYWPSNTTAATIATTSGSVITTGSSGNYFAEIVPTTSQAGIWDYRWSSTGTLRLSQWGSFKVLETPRST